MFIPLIFACTIAAPAAPTICENVPEMTRASRFQHAADCLTFARDQAPKVVAMFAGRDVYITTRCAEVVETCMPDMGRDQAWPQGLPRSASFRVEPYVGGAPACTGAADGIA